MFLYLRRSLLNEKILSKVYKNIELCMYVAWLAVLGQCTGQVQLYIIHTETLKLQIHRKIISNNGCLLGYGCNRSRFRCYKFAPKGGSPFLSELLKKINKILEL